MSEDVIRCSKCGGTVSGETCTACGETGQAIKCAHCGSICPGDAKWCPSCGRHITPAAAGEQPAPDVMVSGGGNTLQLVGLLCLVVVLCILILRAPKPAAISIDLLAIGFGALPGSLYKRLARVVPLLAGGVVALGVVSLATIQRHVSVVQHVQAPQLAVRSPAPGSGSVNAPFVRGKMIVRFQDGKDGAIDHDLAARDLTAAWIAADGRTIRETSTDDSRSPAFEMDPDTHDVTVTFDPRIPVDSAVEAFKRDPAVVFAEPDYILEASHVPNDPYLNENYESSRGPLNQWYLKKIQAPEGWDKLKSVDSQLRLAIIDTGIDFDHPDLKDRMARDSKGQLVGRNFVNPRQSPQDDNGHGTHCAGIACASTDNKIGVAGVGFNSFKLVPAKVLTGRGYGELGWIARAITWAADSGCRVESLSLGGGRYSQALQDAVDYAWKKGTIVVAAAGNANSSRPGYPAGCNHVVAVSATDQNDARAVFSNYGTPIAVGAPGVAILATMPTYACDLTRNHGFKNNYDGLSGTSMACPVVSGITASLLAYQPSLTATEAVERLEQTADNTAKAKNGGWEMNFGHGRVNLANTILNRSRGATVGSFYGQVVNRGLPVMSAVVRCGEVSVTTGDDGMFRLPNYPAGSHKIEVTAGDKKAAVNAVTILGADRDLVISMGGKA